MTPTILHRNFKMELDKSEVSSYPSFLPTEIDYFLNLAVNLFIKTRYSGFNAHRTSLEQTQKRIDDLRLLTKKSELTQAFSDTYGDNTMNHFLYPEDYMFAVGDSVQIGGKIVDATEATNENLDSKLNNSLSTHLAHHGTVRPIRMYDNEYIKLYYSLGTIVDKYYLTYIRKPEVILNSSVTELSDFPDYAWDEILKIAVRLALENISDSRYSTYSQESQLVE